MIPGVDSWAVAVALSRWILFGVRGRGFRLALLSMIPGVAWSLPRLSKEPPAKENPMSKH